MEDIIIIGSGPAGMTAGLYAARAGLKPVVLEGLESGGQLMRTQHVANYPGFVGTVSGPQIIKAMREQAEQAGVRFVMDAVQSVDFRRGGVPAAPEQNPANLLLRTLMGDVLEAKAVIVATGAGVTKTNLPGEAKYWGRGISACLTCDGAFYKDKRVVIVGEGPAAAGAKTYLMRCGATIAKSRNSPATSPTSQAWCGRTARRLPRTDSSSLRRARRKQSFSGRRSPSTRRGMS